MRLNTVPFLTFICILSISSLGCENTPEEPQIHPDGPDAGTQAHDNSDAGVNIVYSENVGINELSSSGDDPIELFNIGFEDDVDLSGWLLTDELAEGADAASYDAILDDSELVFPGGTLLAARGYLVINKGEADGQHPFGLSGDGDTVTLMNPAGAIVQQVTYAAGDAEKSYCRLPESQWLTDPDPFMWGRCEPTFGSENMLPLCGNGVLDDGEVCDGDVGDATCAGLEGFSGGTLACAEDCLSYDTTGCELENTPTCAAGVRLNEVCHKDSKCGVEGTTTGDWLELHNTTNVEVDISGCHLKILEDDDSVRLELVQLASVSGFETVSIAANGYFVINDNDALIDAGNDNTVFLYGDDGTTLINSLVTSSAYQTETESCSIDEAGDTPTPGAANICAEP